MQVRRIAHPFNILFLQLCMFYAIHLTCTQSFRSLGDYHFHIQVGKEEHLRDTGILPDGEDVDIYLFKNEPKSFFFPLEGQDTPAMSITVTPCSSIIEWKVFYHPQGPDKRNSLEVDPLFLQQRISQRLSTTPATTMRHLHTFQGRDMTTFQTHGTLPNGVLRIVLVAIEKNSKVQLFATSSPQAELAYPLAPSTPGIDILSNVKSSVTVAWKLAPSHYLMGQKTKYCVAFNPRQNYRTLCALKADLEGDPPPPWPKNAGFGFASEETTKNRISNLRKSIYKSLRPKRDIHFECVGGRHWATVTSLLANKQYYVNVFAVNEFTNRSIAYTGATFVTSQRPPLVTLRPGIVHTLQTGGSGGAQTSYGFGLKSYTKKLNIFMQGCGQEVKADVIYEGAVTLWDIPVHGFQKTTLRHADVGNYSIRLKTREEYDGKVHQVKLCYTGKMRKCPYNSVPSNLFLNATKNIASCRSVTFQWTAADSHTKYCLYRKNTLAHGTEEPNEEDDYDAEVPKAKCYLNPTSEQFKGHEKVFCRQYKKSSPQRSGKTITETVWGLKMDTTYVFHLQGVLKQGIVIDYDPVIVSMGDKCT